MGSSPMLGVSFLFYFPFLDRPVGMKHSTPNADVGNWQRMENGFERVGLAWDMSQRRRDRRSFACPALPPSHNPHRLSISAHPPQRECRQRKSPFHQIRHRTHHRIYRWRILTFSQLRPSTPRVSPAVLSQRMSSYLHGTDFFAMWHRRLILVPKD